MAGKVRKPVLSSEDWTRRFRIVFLVSLVLMLVLIVLAFTMYRADVLRMVELQNLAKELAAADAANAAGGLL